MTNMYQNPFIALIDSAVVNDISIINYFITFTCSLLLHLVCFYFLSPRTFEYIKNSYVFYISIFIFYLFLAYHGNTVYLDGDDITVKVTLENTTFSLTGEGLRVIFDNLGSAGVFVAGAIIAATIVPKKLAGLPKTGIILATGAGSTLTYKFVSRVHVVNEAFANTQGFNISSGPVTIEMKSPNINIFSKSSEASELLKSQFPQSVLDNLASKGTDKSKLTDLSTENVSAIIKELEKVDPN